MGYNGAEVKFEALPVTGEFQGTLSAKSGFCRGKKEELMKAEEIQEVLYLYNANTFFSDTSLQMVLEI